MSLARASGPVTSYASGLIGSLRSVALGEDLDTARAITSS
jgi:hypothetical protein